MHRQIETPASFSLASHLKNKGETCGPGTATADSTMVRVSENRCFGRPSPVKVFFLREYWSQETTNFEISWTCRGVDRVAGVWIGSKSGGWQEHSNAVELGRRCSCLSLGHEICQAGAKRNGETHQLDQDIGWCKTAERHGAVRTRWYGEGV